MAQLFGICFSPRGKHFASEELNNGDFKRSKVNNEVVEGNKTM